MVDRVEDFKKRIPEFADRTCMCPTCTISVCSDLIEAANRLSSDAMETILNDGMDRDMALAHMIDTAKNVSSMSWVPKMRRELLSAADAAHTSDPRIWTGPQHRKKTSK